MGNQWLKEIAEILTAGGIRAGEGFSGGRRMEIREPVAAVGLRNVNFRTGEGTFEVRMLWPASLGGWAGQDAAVLAVSLLEEAGVCCSMDPMEYLSGCDCFQILILARKAVAEPLYPKVWINGKRVSGVVEFSAEQEQNRRLIRSAGASEPVGITSGNGGWNIRMVQEFPAGRCGTEDWGSRFLANVEEQDVYTTYYDCGWNRMVKRQDQDRTRVEWEGFALKKEEVSLG